MSGAACYFVVVSAVLLPPFSPSLHLQLRPFKLSGAFVGIPSIISAAAAAAVVVTNVASFISSLICFYFQLKVCACHLLLLPLSLSLSGGTFNEINYDSNCCRRVSWKLNATSDGRQFVNVGQGDCFAVLQVRHQKDEVRSRRRR